MGVAGWNIMTGSGKLWFGTLLGPEKTPGWFGLFFLAAPGLDRLTPAVVWVVVVCGVGVWLCVECCIVDASILL